MTNGNSEAGKKPIMVESILDLNANNVWDLSDYQIGELWERDRKEEDFSTSEDKLLNIIRLAFEVVHYNVDDPRDVQKYESGGWVKICHCNPARGVVAIRRKSITRISDLSYENIRHISAPELLSLLEANFGSGWESLSLQIRDVIETGFDISTRLPRDLMCSRYLAALGPKPYSPRRRILWPRCASWCLKHASTKTAILCPMTRL